MCVMTRWVVLLLLLQACPGAIAEPCRDFLAFDDGLVPLREVFVAVDGDDATGNGSESAPYKSLQRAVQGITPGTAVRMLPGTYSGDVHLSGLSGRADAPIWIGGVAGQPRPVLSGGSTGLQLSRVRYLLLEHLEVTGAQLNGINCDDGGEVADPDATRHVVFRDLDIHDIGTGGNNDCLKLSGLDDYWVLDCTFANGSAGGSGIDHVGCHAGVIARCSFTAMGSNAIQCKGGSTNIEITQNRFKDGGERAVNIGGSTGFEFFRPPLSTSEPNAEARDIQVTANLFEGSSAPVAFVGSTGCVVANNTIINPGNWVVRILQETTSTPDYPFEPCSTGQFVNNLVLYSPETAGRTVNVGPNVAAETFVFANNLWYAQANPAQSTPSLPVVESNPVVGQDPEFRNSTQGDYRIGPSSPARGQGRTPGTVTADNSNDCYANPPSIGAFEYGVLEPVIQSLQASPEGVLLNWTPSDPGYDYTVQSNIRAQDGLWTLADSGEPWPVAGTEVLVEPGEGARFYRLLAVPAAERGKLLSVAKVSSYSTLQITFIFNLAGIGVSPKYGVDTYAFRYETIDPWGARAEATGLFALPQGQPGSLPMASYQHGTVTETNDVPSMDLQQSIPGIGLASQGYATALPDFLGLGGSPGFHPYHHARSEATAAIDLLRAARTWSATNGITFNGQLYLCGYSQGGHATMALHRELETYYAGEFAVTASAPMAGAHDLSGTTLDDFMSGRPLPNPYYVAYFLAAYQSVYHITNSWGDWLAEPYATTLPPLLEARAPGGDINAAMPPNATLIFKPEVMQAVLNDPQHPLRLALADNDLYDWTPLAPVRMWHCLGDMDVPYENSLVALAALQANGASSVELLDPSPSSGHGDCAIPSFTAMAAWFDSLR